MNRNMKETGLHNMCMHAWSWMQHQLMNGEQAWMHETWTHALACMVMNVACMQKNQHICADARPRNIHRKMHGHDTCMHAWPHWVLKTSVAVHIRRRFTVGLVIGTWQRTRFGLALGANMLTKHWNLLAKESQPIDISDECEGNVGNDHASAYSTLLACMKRCFLYNLPAFTCMQPGNLTTRAKRNIIRMAIFACNLVLVP